MTFSPPRRSVTPPPFLTRLFQEEQPQHPTGDGRSTAAASEERAENPQLLHLVVPFSILDGSTILRSTLRKTAAQRRECLCFHVLCRNASAWSRAKTLLSFHEIVPFRIHIVGPRQGSLYSIDEVIEKLAQTSPKRAGLVLPFPFQAELYPECRCIDPTGADHHPNVVPVHSVEVMIPALISSTTAAGSNFRLDAASPTKAAGTTAQMPASVTGEPQKSPQRSPGGGRSSSSNSSRSGGAAGSVSRFAPKSRMLTALPSADEYDIRQHITTLLVQFQQAGAVALLGGFLNSSGKSSTLDAQQQQQQQQQHEIELRALAPASADEMATWLYLRAHRKNRKMQVNNRYDDSLKRSVSPTAAAPAVGNSTGPGGDQQPSVPASAAAPNDIFVELMRQSQRKSSAADGAASPMKFRFLRTAIQSAKMPTVDPVLQAVSR